MQASVFTNHPNQGEEREMTTATVQSPEKPRLRERVSTTAAEKPQPTRKKARSTYKRPKVGASDNPTPTQWFGDSAAAKDTPDTPDTPEACGRRPPEQQAALAKRAILPAALASAIGMDQYIESTGYRRYLDDLLKDAGNPTDPIEIMLLEQLAVCHLRAAQLHGHAGQAAGLEAVTAYNAAAARLTAEFRKTALALKEYRHR